MRHSWTLMLALSVAALASCKGKEGTSNDASAPPVKVETAAAVEIVVPVQLHVTGSLKGMKEAELAANAAGRIVKTMVERGDEVKANQIIAQIDTSSAALNLAEARVMVDTSRTQEQINQTECKRYEQLLASQAISPAEFDSINAKCKTAPLALKSAEARQSIAAKNVGDGTIRAPFDGVVSERFVDVGEYVQAQSKVIAIAQSKELRLEFTVPEASVADVKTGADATFTVAAYKDKPFHGTVRFVSGAVRASTRDLVVEALVPNVDHQLLPGMFADVALTTGTRKLPSVPVSAVFERLEKKHVMVVKNGRLEERVLQVGPEADGRISVESGVVTGEPVVTANGSTFTNGARVQ